MVSVVNRSSPLPCAKPLEMNTHAYTAQQHVPTNQPQNSVKFVIDELTGKYRIGPDAQVFLTDRRAAPGHRRAHCFRNKPTWGRGRTVEEARRSGAK